MTKKGGCSISTTFREETIHKNNTNSYLNKQANLLLNYDRIIELTLYIHEVMYQLWSSVSSAVQWLDL